LESIVYFAKSLPTASAERKILAQLWSFYEWYASAGLTEATARERHDVVTTVVHFDSTIRTIIDGRKIGFCKLIVDRKTAKILGCHVVGERAVEIAQVAAIRDAGG
jgi:pyruvate/2-oxoglutarate dehydrogenase complex dihydrolipoamide dehydrogenase (E3) component